MREGVLVIRGVRGRHRLEQNSLSVYTPNAGVQSRSHWKLTWKFGLILLHYLEYLNPLPSFGNEWGISGLFSCLINFILCYIDGFS